NRAHSDRAWRELVARYDATINKRLRWVVSNCARIFRASDTSEDIKAEVFAALLWKDMYRLRAFDPAKRSFDGWLSVIVQQTAMTHLTKLVRDAAPNSFD